MPTFTYLHQVHRVLRRAPLTTPTPNRVKPLSDEEENQEMTFGTFVYTFTEMIWQEKLTRNLTQRHLETPLNLKWRGWSPRWLDLSFRLKKAIYSSNDTQKKVEKITIALEVVGYIRKSIGIMHREQAGNWRSHTKHSTHSIHRLGRIVMLPQTVHVPVVRDGQWLALEVFSDLHHRSLGLDAAAKVNQYLAVRYRLMEGWSMRIYAWKLLVLLSWAFLVSS